MISIQIIISLVVCLQLINAAPIVITRLHTAAAVTQVVTEITGTTTVWLPPVGIYISDGQTSTSTITEGQWNTYPVTITSIVHKDQVQPQTTTEAETQQQQPTTTETQPETTEQAQAQVQPETTEQAQPQVQPETTEQAQPQVQPETTEQAQTQQETTSEVEPQTTEIQPETTQAAPTTSEAQPTTTDIQQETTSSTYQQQQQQQQEETTSSTYQQQQETTSSTSTTSQQQQQETTSSTTSSQQQETSATSSSSSGNIPAPSVIVYSPYADNGGCKTPDEIESDITMIHGKGIYQIRSYGTDCYALTTVLETCKNLGMTVNQGVWLSEAGVDSIDDQINDIISYGQSNGWDVFNLLTIANEAINSNFCTVDELITKLNSVKTQLTNAGYTGKMTTAEPPATFIKYPELCTSANIDVVGINPHSYFNANISPANAGSYIVSQQSEVAGLCNGKDVVITETGYPSRGSTLGLNVPSDENQKIAIASIISETNGDCTILTTYNDFWKDPGPYGIEQYFGTIQLFA